MPLSWATTATRSAAADQSNGGYVKMIWPPAAIA